MAQYDADSKHEASCKEQACVVSLLTASFINFCNQHTKMTSFFLAAQNVKVLIKFEVQVNWYNNRCAEDNKAKQIDH